MPLYKRTPQGQARRLKQWIPFSDALHNNKEWIHLLFSFQEALQTLHSRHAAQQPAATQNKSLQSRVHNRNSYISSPSHNPVPKDQQQRGKRSLKGSYEKEEEEPPRPPNS